MVHAILSTCGSRYSTRSSQAAFHGNTLRSLVYYIHMDSYTRRIPFPYSFGSRVGYCSIRRYSVPFRFIASASSPHPDNYVCWPRNSSCGSWYLCRPATRFFVNWFPHYSHSSRYQRSTIRIIHAVNSFTIWHPSPYARRLFGDVHARRERGHGFKVFASLCTGTG